MANIANRHIELLMIFGRATTRTIDRHSYSLFETNRLSILSLHVRLAEVPIGPLTVRALHWLGANGSHLIM